MDFNFDTRKTLPARALKISSFPLFGYAKIISQIFFCLGIISLVLVGSSFFGFIAQSTAIRMLIGSAFFALLFFEIHVFITLCVKKLQTSVSLLDAILPQSISKYNLAEFLSLTCCQIVQESIIICKKKRFSQVTSEMLFYASLKENNDCRILLYRLGVDVAMLQKDLKNYLEKQPREARFNLSLSDSFKETITKAVALSAQRGYNAIGEKELLAALAQSDPFFKQVLINHELKEKDVENITLWLGTLEDKIKKRKQFWTKESLSTYGSLGKDWASGFTVTLDKFSIDWDKVIRRNIFNEIIGHKKEVDEVEVVLAKSGMANVLLVGEKGVGRKSIVEALARRCFLATGLPELHNKRVVELNMVSLVTQIQDPETLEITLDQIFSEVLSAGNVILVIDELDNFLEQKVSRPGSVDVSVILGKYLPMENFHFIGITSFDGLHRRLDQNAAFLENFRKIEVSEVSELETIMILQNLALAVEQKYKVLVMYPAIREIVNLTGRYFPSTPFPKKAIDVLDEAVMYIRSLKEKVLLPSHVAKIISDKTKIPLGKMEFKEKSVLLNLENLIHERIVNQQEAISQIATAMRRARSGISSKKRPMGVFLFLGPTGVGKTETAKALAEIYFGTAGSSASAPEKMIRIDMSEFQSISDIGRLIGQVSPVEEQGLLTTPVRDNPFSLVLLDEIEKAHPNILNLFLQVFDEGHVTDGQGRKVIFTNTIIICTSNAGASLIFEQVEAGQKIDKEKIFNFLFEKGIFKPEFVNRFDATVFFHALTKENLLDIAQLTLVGIQKNLKEKEIDFIITDALKEKIVSLSYKPEFGAREMRRVVQDNIENAIAQALLSDMITKGDVIEVNPEDFSITKHHSNV